MEGRPNFADDLPKDGFGPLRSPLCGSYSGSEKLVLMLAPFASNSGPDIPVAMSTSGPSRPGPESPVVDPLALNLRPSTSTAGPSKSPLSTFNSGLLVSTSGPERAARAVLGCSDPSNSGPLSSRAAFSLFPWYGSSFSAPAAQEKQFPPFLFGEDHPNPPFVLGFRI